MHQNMFYNTFASKKEDQLFNGKYMNNKVPPNTARHGPPESFNISYDKSSRVGLHKTKHNKYSLKILKMGDSRLPRAFRIKPSHIEG